MMKRISIIGVILLSLGLGGCSIVAAPYQPSIENAQAMKRADLPKMNVGTVLGNQKNQSISLRGTKMNSATADYGSYIANALTAELKLANLYEPMSATVISGELLSHDINVGSFTTGTGVISMKFVISKSNTQVLEKTVSADIEFESSFMGAIAIPNGQMAYKDLVQSLIKTALSDPEIVAALKQ
jgi:hypothetical protein